MTTDDRAAEPQRPMTADACQHDFALVEVCVCAHPGLSTFLAGNAPHGVYVCTRCSAERLVYCPPPHGDAWWAAQDRDAVLFAQYARLNGRIAEILAILGRKRKDVA